MCVFIREKGEVFMSEILELLGNCSKFFYLGLDSEAWLCFSRLVEVIQSKLVSDTLNDEAQQELMTFVVQLDQIEKLKKEKNFTVIADILYDTQSRIMKLRG
jgi:hypothetical protein